MAAIARSTNASRAVASSIPGRPGRATIARVICPPSGRLLVVPSSWYPEEIVRCDWAIRESPP